MFALVPVVDPEAQGVFPHDEPDWRARKSIQKAKSEASVLCGGLFREISPASCMAMINVLQTALYVNDICRKKSIQRQAASVKFKALLQLDILGGTIILDNNSSK
jgi:hypothetical protein